MPTSSYHSPFGTYPKDMDLTSVPLHSLEELEPGAKERRVLRYSQEGIIVKEYYKPFEDEKFTPFNVERIWSIMELAGECCVSIVGRAFRGPDVCGFCMPIESPIDTVNIATKEERTRIIYQLRDLVAKLHGKNIVHGDVKPQNLLLCSDGELRLCDFDDASVEGDGYTMTNVSYPYCSPFRARNQAHDTYTPLTRAEDVYAMGLSMWEIYTGRLPLTSDDENTKAIYSLDLDNRCYVGLLPDMELIDDPAIAALIETCLSAGPECPETTIPDSIYCLETRFEFAVCKAEPRHRYSQPKVSTTSLDSICEGCYGPGKMPGLSV
ncbi:kinase-like domain-containing protein [Mycena rebaudengoi]|nr:kinase-like domain-containing protein [Mycena rebaudengoi]